MSNITTANNLVCSGNQTISGNIISNGNLQTNNITSSSISNSNTITTNAINATTGSLTNASVSNLLTLLSNSPITFNYNGTNYTISALMLFTLSQLSGASIASQAYVNTQISNLVNSSPDLLNTLSELANAINNDASFSITMTNLIATKASLSGNNSFTGSNTFSNLPYYVNTSDQLINKAYVDGRFTTLLSANNTFSGSNTFTNDSTGNIINRLFATILSVNNGNLRRSSANYFECGMGATSSYIYYDNSGRFGNVNTNDSSLNWNITLNSVFTINTINSVNLNITNNGIVNNLYSNILSINNNNTRRSTNNIMEVATSSTGNYLYYNNSSTFGFINVSDSNKSWFVNQNGNLNIPIITSPSATINSLSSTNGSVTNLYSNILSINNGTSLRSVNDLFNVSISSTGNYLYYNNSSIFGHINTSNSALSWSINNGSASLPTLTSTTGNVGTLNVSTASTFQNLPNFVNTSDKLINKAYVDDRFITANITTLNVSSVSSTSTLAVGSLGVRGSGNLVTVSVTPTGDYLYLNNGGALGLYNSEGNPTFPWIIDVNGNARFRAFLSNNALNCYPNIITSVTSAKILGLTDILVTTIVLEPFYDNTITISSPISLYRQYRNNSANGQLFNRLYDTLNSVTYTILKNGSTYASGICSTNNTLNREIYVTTNSTTSSTYYEIYIANAECSFTPSISSTSDTYIVNYTVNYSQNISWQSFNLIIESFGYNVNTNISGRDGNFGTGTNGPGSNYRSFNYSLSTSNYSINSSQLQINKIVSNSIQNQNTITTNNLECNNLLSTQQMTPAYMLDGTKTIGFNWHPITCSQYKLKAPDLDDNYVVYPGYKLNLYYNDGYNSYAGTIDNFSGTTLRYAASINIYGGANQINSCRLYYLNDSNEITNDMIS